MIKTILSILIMMFSITVSSASMAAFDDGEEADDKKLVQVSVDLSMFEYTPKTLKKAAMLAFLRRNWELESVEANRFVGSIESASVSTAKVEMLIEKNILTIKSVSGKPKSNWLLNLKKDFLIFLVEESY